MLQKHPKKVKCRGRTGQNATTRFQTLTPPRKKMWCAPERALFFFFLSKMYYNANEPFSLDI
jgi:hypothetical protein